MARRPRSDLTDPGSPSTETDPDPEDDGPPEQTDTEDTEQNSAGARAVDELQRSEPPQPVDDGSTGGDVARSSPRDDLQDAGPGASDSPSGGGTADGDDRAVGGGSDTEPGFVDDDSSSDPSGSDPASGPQQPPGDVQNRGPAGTEPDTIETRSTSDPTAPQPDTTADQVSEPPQGGDDGIVSLSEQYYVDARDYLDGEDVRVEFKNGEGNLELTASGAAATFAAEREGVEESDVTATRGENGGWQIEYTDDARQEQLAENYDPGPSSAGEQISEEAGISDEGSPDDPLEGTGLEAGFGPTADRAREIEDWVTSDPATAGGLQDAGDDGRPTPDEEDVEIQLEDGSFTVEAARDRAVLTDKPSAENRLRRQTTGRTPDVATAAVNQVEGRIEEQLREAGVDPENVDVNARLEDGEVRVGGEDVNGQEVRFPSAGDTDTALGRAFETATAPVFEPFGVDSGAVAGAAADEAGIGGKRVETVLEELSGDYRDLVAEYREPGGEAVQQTTADFLLGPFASGAGAGSVADLAVDVADDRTDADVEDLVEARSADVFEGFASTANVPALALSGKNAAEYAGFAAEETAEGNAAAVVDDATNRATVAGTQASIAFEESPQQFTARLGGALLGGAAAGVGTSAALSGSVRGALRGTRSATRGTASRGLNVGQSAVRRAESRTPSVDVRRDPDAPTVEIDPELRDQIREAVSPPDLPSASDVSGQARLTGARTRFDLGSARARGEFDLSDVTGRVRDAVSDRAGGVRESAEGAVDTARDLPSTAARNVAMEARRVRERASSARARAEFRGSQAAETLSNPSTLTPDVDVNLDQAAQAAGREFELRRRQTELELAALRASGGERLSALADGVPSRRDLGDSAFRVREQVSDAVTSARVGGELALRTRETPGLDGDVGLPDLGRPVRDISDAAYRTRERARQRATSARVGAELMLRSRDFERPSVENPLGGLTDLTVRVGGRDSAEVDAEEFRAPGFDVDEVFDDLGDTDSPNPVAGDSEADVGGGGGQQIIRTQLFGDDDSSTEVDLEQPQRGSRSGPSFGSAAAGGAASGLALSPVDGTPVGSGTGFTEEPVTPPQFDDATVGVFDSLGGFTGETDEETGVDIDVGPRTGPSTDIAEDTGTAFGADLATEQDTRTPRGLESELELETEGAAGAGVPDFGDDDDRDAPVFGAFDSADEVFDTGVVQSLDEAFSEE